MADAAAPARLTLAEAADFLSAARERVRSGEREIDLSPYDVVDSSALAALIELRRLSAPDAVRFSNPSANLRKLADLYGVSALLFS